MKTWKKNMVAAAVLVTVCAGIYLNWLYTDAEQTSDLTDTLYSEKILSEDMLVLSGDAALDAAGVLFEFNDQSEFTRTQLIQY
jgi:hypothetical protein